MESLTPFTVSFVGHNVASISIDERKSIVISCSKSSTHVGSDNPTVTLVISRRIRRYLPDSWIQNNDYAEKKLYQHIGQIKNLNTKELANVLAKHKLKENLDEVLIIAKRLAGTTGK